MPVEVFRGSQAPCSAVCGTCGCFRTMHDGDSAPLCCAFTHWVAFEEVSGPRVLFKRGQGNRGLSACGTTHGASLKFPSEAGFILRCAGKAGDPSRQRRGIDSCRHQEGRRGSDEVVSGPSVFPSREPAVSGNFWAGRRRGTRGFPAAPRQRPRESFFNASRGPSPLP